MNLNRVKIKSLSLTQILNACYLTATVDGAHKVYKVGLAQFTHCELFDAYTMKLTLD